MRELTVNAVVSLDGVMQAPVGPEEDTSEGFEHGGWSVTYWDEAIGEKMGEVLGGEFDLLLGRKTYEIFAAYWPHSEEPGAEELNRAHKYVASRTLTDLTWETTTVLSGDVVAEVGKLKEGEGPELQVHGSSNLLQTLLGSGLIDLLRLWTFPVTLGRGKRLFGEGSVPAGLELADSATFGTGVTMSAYRPAGDVPTGAFAAE